MINNNKGGGVEKFLKSIAIIAAGFVGSKSSEKNGKPREIGGHKACGSLITGMAGLPERKIHRRIK